jgi:glycosyltransferase involved in cell wall biosynthesis
MSRKVCILTSVHGPFDIRIFHKEAKSLAKAGYYVTLIAQHDRDEVVDGVKIVALPRPKNRFCRMVGTWWVLRLAYRQKADIYHFHDPELLPVGLLLKLTTKGKVIYDVHEDYPTLILIKHWLPRILRRPVSLLFNLVEKSISTHLDYVITVVDPLSDKFKGDKVVTVCNYPILEGIQPKSEYDFKSPKLIYVGGLAKERGITEIVQSMEYLDFPRDIKLILCGTFDPASYEEEIRGLRGFERVEYLGWVDPENVPSKLAQAVVGIACLHPETEFVQMPTTKVFEYMAAGVPVIASNFPKWKEFIEATDCGITVDPLNPREIARAIEYLIDHPHEAEIMGRNGRKTVLENYNWETESKKLLTVYADLLGEAR